MLQEQSSNLWAISARKLLLLINHEHCAIPHHILSWLTCIFAKLFTYLQLINLIVNFCATSSKLLTYTHVHYHSYAFSCTLFQDGKRVPHCCANHCFHHLARRFVKLKQKSDYCKRTRTPSAVQRDISGEDAQHDKWEDHNELDICKELYLHCTYIAPLRS